MGRLLASARINCLDMWSLIIGIHEFALDECVASIGSWGWLRGLEGSSQTCGLRSADHPFLE